MAELKTQPNDGDVDEFVRSIADDKRRADAAALVPIMTRVTGTPGRMYGTGIVGFGDRPHRYADGREIPWFRIGFSPRKANLVLYLTGGYEAPETVELLGRLGRHSTGKGCLYLKRLSDADAGVLEELLVRSAALDG